MGWLSRVLSELYSASKNLIRSRGALFWTVVFPILLYALMVGIIAGQAAPVLKVAVVNHDRGLVLSNGTRIDLSEALLRAMNNSGTFKIIKTSNVTSAWNLLKTGKADVGLVIPGNFTQNIIGLEPARLTILAYKSEWGNYSLNVLEGFINGYSSHVREETIQESVTYILANMPGNRSDMVVRWLDFIASPVRVNETVYTPPLLATSEGIKAFYAIGIIGVEVLFIGLSMGVTSIIDLRREGLLQIILSSPISKGELLVGFTLSGLFYVGISAFSIILFSFIVGARYTLSLPSAVAAVVLLLLAALFTIGFGLLLAPLARSQEAAMALVNMIAFPIMFAGGLVMPKFMLPHALQVFASVYPLSALMDTIRLSLLLGYGPGEALMRSVPEIVSTVLVYVLGLLVFTRLLERAIE